MKKPGSDEPYGAQHDPERGHTQSNPSEDPSAAVAGQEPSGDPSASVSDGDKRNVCREQEETPDTELHGQVLERQDQIRSYEMKCADRKTVQQFHPRQVPLSQEHVDQPQNKQGQPGQSAQKRQRQQFS